MTIDQTTRRAIIAGAATLPIAGTLSIALSDAACADQAIVALAEQLTAALGEHKKACATFSVAEEAMFKWTTYNPKPTVAEWPDGDRQAELNAVAEYEAAVRVWGKRKRAAEAQCGYRQAKAIEGATSKQVSRLSEVLADAPANGMRGLAAKAQFADKTGNTELAWAVVQDILAWQPTS